MLIINADDYGKNRLSTDRILLCYQNGRITSATAMMFMEDTERAAALAVESGMDVGLHLNLSDDFTGDHNRSKLDESHGRVSRFIRKNRLSLLLYNPLLRKDFEYTFRSQWNRFVELYGKLPSHVDGHRHRHLCSNALFGGFLPDGIRLRRNFHFEPGEKGILNRLYRSAIDFYLTRRFVSTDYFFSVQPFDDRERILKIRDLSRSADVELMVHPEMNAELLFLMSEEFRLLFENVGKCSYSELQKRNYSCETQKA